MVCVYIYTVFRKKWYICFSNISHSCANFMKLSAYIRKWTCLYALMQLWCCVKNITVTFSEEDKHLIQFYRKTRHLGARRIIKLFPEKKWTLSWMWLITRSGGLCRTGQGLCSQDYQWWRTQPALLWSTGQDWSAADWQCHKTVA